MEIKLFGKNIFEFRNSKRDPLLDLVESSRKESKYLQDFFGNTRHMFDDSMEISEIAIVADSEGKARDIPLGEEERIDITPKGVYELKLLNDEKFELKTDPEYVDQQLKDFKEKFGMIKTEENDWRNGVKEIESIVVRLENRKRYGEFKEFFEGYAYTKTSKIQELLKKHTNLQIGQIAQFIADMPNEATQVMKEYSATTEKLCEKKAVFYIIADKKDFKKTGTRRDQILLAQSPFGHFWQILGAWDSEMLFLEEL